MRDIEEKLEAASIAMARVVADSSRSAEDRAFVQKRWLRLAKLQVDFEDRSDRAAPSSSKGKEGA